MPELHYIGISAAFDPYAEAEPVSYCPNAAHRYMTESASITGMEQTM